MSGTAWRVKGQLIENCNCTLVCPGHMSFKQLYTHERCIGAWGPRFGRAAGGILAGYGLWMLVA